MDQVVFLETAMDTHAQIDCVGIPKSEETEAIDLAVFFQMQFESDEDTHKSKIVDT